MSQGVSGTTTIYHRYGKWYRSPTIDFDYLSAGGTLAKIRLVIGASRFGFAV